MPTPNPNTIKFLVNMNFFEKGTVDFETAESAKGSELPETLFEIEGVTGVMIGFNFVSVTKAEATSWESVLESTRDTILDVIDSGKSVLSDEAFDRANQVAEAHGEIAQKIIKILDEEIRPAIAMDGGDVQFISFIDGIVTLKLQGACSTCPAATMTLKMGIENRMKEEIPEVKEVVQEL
ncbi:NifU family protein [bacterium]|nr:NifU family protein [bacterium]